MDAGLYSLRSYKQRSGIFGYMERDGWDRCLVLRSTESFSLDKKNHFTYSFLKLK